MRKRRILGIVIPLVAATTVVGSGFSAWYFGSETISTSNDVTFEVTDKVTTLGTLTTTVLDIDKGEYELSTTGTATNLETVELKIVLDQGGYQYKKDFNYGIHFEVRKGTAGWKKAKSIQIKYTIKKADYKNLETTLIPQFTYTLSLDSQVASYVNFKDGYVTTETVKFDNSDDFSIDGTNYNYAKTLDISSNDLDSNAMLCYTDKPTEEGSYDIMKTAIAGSKLNLAAQVIATNK